jgi:hypothetical protein
MILIQLFKQEMVIFAEHTHTHSKKPGLMNSQQAHLIPSLSNKPNRYFKV